MPKSEFDERLHAAAYSGDKPPPQVETPLTAAFKPLIKSGVDVNVWGNGGPTLLYWAASWGDMDACSLLISVGADVNVKLKENGWTPLHAAADYGSQVSCEILIKSGANVGALDARGRTPIELATDDSVKGSIRAAISQVEMQTFEKSTSKAAKRKRVKKPKPVQSMSI